MMSDVTRALAERLRNGEFTTDDLNVAQRMVRRFGIPPAECRAIRDSALIEYARRECTKLHSLAAIAKALHLALCRYGSGEYKSLGHQNASELPAKLAGSSRAHLWTALKHGALRGGVALSAAQLERILKSGRSNSMRERELA